MTDYLVRFTDINTTPITVPEDTVNRDDLGLPLFGRIFQNYGQDVNENLLNLLENFACPESPLTTNLYDAVPDLNETSKTQLSEPIVGQFWYNSTRGVVYHFDGIAWIPIPLRGSYAANWGQIVHGQQLPRPVNQQGYMFPYAECIWSVSPASINGSVDMMNCNTDANALVTMQYRYTNTTTMVNGIANYLIIGITGNTNEGIIIPPIQPSPTPTATVSPTPHVSPTPAPSSTPMATPTPTPTTTPTVMPTRTSTPAPSVTPTRTATPIVSPTPTPTVSGFGPLVELPTSRMDAYGEVFWSSVPCRPGGQSGTAGAGGHIDVGGGSGSFTYAWSFVQDPLSNFPTSRVGIGNEFTVTGPLASCPYQGGAWGTVQVIVTDTVTGQQATFTGTYQLEYTG